MIRRRTFLQSLPLLESIAVAQTAPPAASGERVHVQPRILAPWNGQLGFALDPAVPEWRLEGEEGDRVSYSGGDYRLELTFEHPQPHLLTLRFRLERADGKPFTVRSYTVKAQLSLIGIYRLWNGRNGPTELSDSFNVYTRGWPSEKDYAEVYGANSGSPVMLCTDREGRNRFTLGMLDQVEATGLKIGTFSLGLSKRGEGLNYTFEFVKPVGYTVTRSTLTDGAWFDTRSGDWFGSIGEYTSWVEKASKLRILKPPAVAYEPIWNTWYPFGQAIDEKIIRDNADFCRKLGIINLSLDAGYNNALTEGMGTAEQIEDFNNHTGDWTADTGKFPDFRGLVERLHRNGQKVTVWVALFIVGKSTHAYPGVRHMLMRNAAGKEQEWLCPRHPDTPNYLARTFLKLAKDYDLDGFWLDFMDSLHVPCRAAHPHFTSSPGEAYNRCLIAVRDATIGWKPEFLIETRRKMANINAKQFANVLETSDMPFDFDLNRGWGVALRSFSQGVAVKIDPVQWHIRESNQNVAKSCATVTLTGVPVFGVDFRLLPESHVRVVAAWMGLYRRYRQELAQGQFTPIGLNGLFPQFLVRSGSKAFLYLGSSATAPVGVAGCEEVHVVNASDTGRVAVVLDGLAPGSWRGVTRDCFLQETGTHDFAIGKGSFWLDAAIPEGGILTLRRG